MADVAITITKLVLAARSIDMIAGGASVNSGQTFEIADPSGSLARDMLIILEEEGGGAAVVTFDAGDDPPALLQDLGSLDITLATADLRIVVLEGARHCQDDGKITGSVTTNDVRIYVLQLPHTF